QRNCDAGARVAVRKDATGSCSMVSGTACEWVQETEPEAEMKRVDQSVRLIIAVDHPLLRGALLEVVSGLFDEIEIAEAGSFEDVAKLLERGGEVDLILLDLTMPGVRGFSGL